MCIVSSIAIMKSILYDLGPGGGGINSGHSFSANLLPALIVFLTPPGELLIALNDQGTSFAWTAS